jgi:hypothetical protein
VQRPSTGVHAVVVTSSASADKTWKRRIRSRRMVSRMTTDAVAQGCPVHESFDPLSPEYLADPYAVLASLPLEEGSVFYAPSIGYYVVTRYADVMQVYGDPQTYSAAVRSSRWPP